LVDTQALAVQQPPTPTGVLLISSYTATNTTASLTAINTLSDQDGPALVPTFQWQRLVGTTWTDIAGGTGATLSNQSDLTARVVSIYTDAFGLNTVISNETALIGTTLDDTITGTAGNDNLLGLGGSDILDGGAGTDVAIFSGAMAGYYLD
jgi:hypothetical protein